MKQLIQIFITDIRMNFKHWMGAYMIIVPLIILLVLRFFIPNVESTRSTIAVVTEGTHAVPAEMIAVLDPYAKIKKYPSIEDMQQKLRGTGSAEGLYWSPEENRYISVLERSVTEGPALSLASQIIRQQELVEKYPLIAESIEFAAGVPEELSDRTAISPVATMGGAIFFVFMIIIAGFMIGLGIVDDKENGTDRAILVSPVSKSDYFIGKSIFPLLIIAVYAIISLLILGLMDANIGQIYTVAIVSFSVTLLFGLLLGALANNENEVIGIGKLLSWIVMMAILGGALLPDNWQWAVWWAPFYWIYNIIESVFTESATWTAIFWKSGVTIGLTGVIAFLLRKRIIKGLS